MHRRLSGRSAASAHLRNSQGRGHGSNRSREGPHPPSPRRRPAERGRRRAGPSRLARSKGSPGQRDDDGGEQIANSLPPRPRPYGLTPVAGIRLPTTTDSTDNKAAVARLAAARAERNTPPRAGLKYWDERTQRVLEPVPRRQCPTAPEVPTFP